MTQHLIYNPSTTIDSAIEGLQHWIRNTGTTIESTIVGLQHLIWNPITTIESTILGFLYLGSVILVPPLKVPLKDSNIRAAILVPP